MKIRLCVWFLGFISIINTALAAPIASVDRTQLALNDTVTLQISDDNASDNDPNLAPLNHDFNVVSTTTSAEIQLVNNTARQQKTWAIVLTPKHSGELTIPSLTVGKDKTSPLAIQVAAADNITASPNDIAANTTTTTAVTAHNNNSPIFMQASIDPKTVYEGQAALYTVKIFYNTSVREPSLSIPDMGAVKLIHVGKDTNQRTIVNGETYQVLEQHYALIAEEDGHLSIKSPVLQGYRLDISGSTAFSEPWQPFHVTAPASELVVNTIPGMSKSTWWLPSTKVTVTDSWADNPPHFENGVPVTRTLTVTAQNVTAEQLPSIAPQKNDGFQLYPDKPILKTDSNGFQLQASRTEKIAYLPNKTGQFTLPAISVDWWNTDNNAPQTVTLPAYNVQVTANTTPGANNSEMPPALLSLQNDTIRTITTKQASWYTQPFIMLSLLLTFAWVITLFLWWRTAKPKVSTKTTLAPHSEDVKTMRQLRTDLRKACQQNNILDAKVALLAIGKELWPYETVLSVGDLADKFQQQQTKDLLQELESVLYKESTVWHGGQLWNCLDQEFRLQAKNSTDPTDVLPHLYLEEKS